MAFVFRSEKETTPVKSDPNLGPGSYMGLSKFFNITMFLQFIFILN